MAVRPATTMVCAILALAGATHPASAQQPVRLALTRVGGAFDFQYPVVVTQPAGETRRLYVAGHGGPIWVVRDGVTLPTRFLDLSGAVAGGTAGEAGLLGMAFHPAFASNGFFYVSYPSTSPQSTRVVRYHTDPANPDVADPASAYPIVSWSPALEHFGGWLGFGPDGYLYISVGDQLGPAFAAGCP